MSNLRVFENLSKPNSLTLVKSKKLLEMSNYVLILSISCLRNLQYYTTDHVV